MHDMVDDSNWEPTLRVIQSGEFLTQIPSRRQKLMDWPLFTVRSRKALDTTPYSEVAPIGDEIYERVIDLSWGGHYRLVWDIATARAIAQRDHVGPQFFAADDLLPGVVTADLDLPHVYQTDPTQGTVVVAEYPLLEEKFVILDGNHRIFLAHHSGSDVAALVLGEEQMCEALCHERFRLYYAIHWNLSRWLTIEVTGRVPAAYPWFPLTKEDKAGPPLLDRESP